MVELTEDDVELKWLASDMSFATVETGIVALRQRIDRQTPVERIKSLAAIQWQTTSIYLIWILF